MLSAISHARRPRSRLTAVTHALPGRARRNGHGRARGAAVVGATAALAAAGGFIFVNRDKQTSADGGEKPSNAARE
jgi:hypothetical protein